MAHLRSALLLFAMVLPLSAANALPFDYKIPVAFDRKMKPRDVCGSMATARFYNLKNSSYSSNNRDCAPTVGRAFALTQRQKSIAIIDGKPDLDSYLARIKRRGSTDLDGESGSICGGGATSPFPTSFNALTPTFENDFTITYSLDGTLEARVAADIDSILNDYQIPQAVRDRLNADIRTTLAANKDKLVKFRAKFQEYQLPDATLTALEAATDGANPLAPCLTELRSGQWRIYRAVTGIRILEANSTENLENIVAATIAAQIKSKVATVNIIDLKAEISRKVITNVNAVERERFTVIGVSYWKSNRWSEIN
jgi:hypothetical protein